jgi:outer membrane lipoprotein-sorting protein
MSFQKVRIQLAVLALFVLASVAAQAQMPQPFSADFSSTTPNTPAKTGKFYFSQSKMRMDMTMPQGQGKGSPFGGNVSMIINSTTHTSYMLMPQAHMYMEIQATGAQDMQGMRNLESLSHGGDLCSSNPGSSCKKVGTETMNGRSCDKWEMTDKNAHKSIVWVDQKLFFPVRVQEYEGTVTDFTNIKEGAQDASLFVVPPGYQKFDASAFQRQR